MDPYLTKSQVTELINNMLNGISKKDIIGWVVNAVVIFLAALIPFLVVRNQIKLEKNINETNQLKEKLYEFSLLIESITPIVQPRIGKIDDLLFKTARENIVSILAKIRIFDTTFFAKVFADKIKQIEKLIDKMILYYMAKSDLGITADTDPTIMKLGSDYLLEYQKDLPNQLILEATIKANTIEKFREEIAQLTKMEK
jgi:hypothetical protein